MIYCILISIIDDCMVIELFIQEFLQAHSSNKCIS